MGYTRAELEAYRDTEVPDLIGPGCALLFAGINPGLWTAATGAHFARPGNRFYPALLAAGIIERPIDPSAGMSDTDRDHLVARGVGITNLVRRATARADELTAAELRDGAAQLLRLVGEVKLAVVAVAGITAYRAAFGRRKATQGPQEQRLGGAQLFVVFNPSGLNAHDTVASLAAAYREAAHAAGVVPA